MKAMKKKRAGVSPLLYATGAALALVLAGCKGGSGGSATTEPAAATTGGETNSAAATNSSAAGTSQ
jgi:hypothetical protein